LKDPVLEETRQNHATLGQNSRFACRNLKPGSHFTGLKSRTAYSLFELVICILQYCRPSSFL